MEKYIVQAKCVFSKFIDVHIVEAVSNDHAIQQWRSLNSKLGLNINTRYIKDSIKVNRETKWTSEVFFRDIRLANSSTVADHNCGLTSDDDDFGNPTDKHILTREEAKRVLSRLDYAELFVNTDLSDEEEKEIANNPPF